MTATYHFRRACRQVHRAAAVLPGQTDAGALALALVFARTWGTSHPEWVPALERQAARAVGLRARWGWRERIFQILS